MQPIPDSAASSDPATHYKLGEPMHEDVIAGHILAEARPAHWCSLEQKWVD